MKYIKAEAPFALKDGKKTLIQTFYQEEGKSSRDNAYAKALMSTNENMVLMQDIKALLPYTTRGLVIGHTHSLNVAGITELRIHPEIWDELISRGVIDEQGNSLKVKPAPAPEQPAEAAPEPTRTEGENDPAVNPLDVNKDGVVDAKDVAEVANAAAVAEEEATEESVDEGESEETSEDSTSADPTEG